MIKLADLLNERKVDGMVFVDKWKKALKLLKQKGGWSPHFRKGSEPVGYTTQIFWVRYQRDMKTRVGLHFTHRL